MDRCACVIFYNDGPELLEQCLKCLYANSFGIITVDGAFQEFLKLDSNLKPYSTDGCIDIARAYADFHIDAPKNGWYDQATKRNQYVNLVPDGKYFFVIDADEFMLPFKEIAGPMIEDVYRIMERRHEPGQAEPMKPFSSVRVYKKYPDLAYRYRHCTIYRLKNHVEGDLRSGLITQAKSDINTTRPILKDIDGNYIMIDHKKNMRDSNRLKLKEQFYSTRKETEYRRMLNDF